MKLIAMSPLQGWNSPFIEEPAHARMSWAEVCRPVRAGNEVDPEGVE